MPQIKSKSIKCNYQTNWFLLPEYLSMTTSYYRCALDTRKLEYNKRTNAITGQHQIGKNDLDVRHVNSVKHNSLKVLSSLFCVKFNNLDSMQLNNLQMRSVDEDALEKCVNLRYFAIDSNKIVQLPEYMLLKNVKLMYVWLFENKLTTLPENFFMNQIELRNLLLHKNHISFLPPKIFKPLVQLKELWIKNNKLQALDIEWFISLQNLEYLDLSNNQLSEIPSNIFSPLVSLLKLYLHENKIKFINSRSFNGLQELKFLRLTKNDLTELPDGAFTQLKNLETLGLGLNKLSEIREESFGVHNQLTTLDLKANKIYKIERKLIENSPVFKINMLSNICADFNTEIKSEIISKMSTCFENFQLVTSVITNSSPSFTTSLPSTTSSLQSIFIGQTFPENPRTILKPTTQAPLLDRILQQNHLSESKVTISCGKPFLAQGTIIGGAFIARGSFPWIAALIYSKNDIYFCGGTLISNQKVVTAAHCIQDKYPSGTLLPKELNVLLGAHNITKKNEVGRRSFAVFNIVVHPEWNPQSERFHADIAVLVLDEFVTFDRMIQPICMIQAASNAAAIRIGLVVGYGKSENQLKIHEETPKIIEVPIHENEDCFLQFPDLARISSKKTFCGGHANGTGVCLGDSGSGLVVFYNGTYYFRGIVSSSIRTLKMTCDLNQYSVFTDVLKFIEWIEIIETQETYSG